MSGEERKILEAAAASKTGLVFLYKDHIRCAISFGDRDRGWAVKLSEYTKYLDMLEKLESIGFLTFVESENNDQSSHGIILRKMAVTT